MIASMTGYSARVRDIGRGALHLELKSVNSRFLDLFFRLGDEVRGFEPLLRERIAAKVSRGKLECRLYFVPAATVSAQEPNGEAIARLVRWQSLVQSHSPDTPPLSTGEILRWPGVFAEESLDGEALAAAVGTLIDEALEDFTASRRREGDKLAAMIRERTVRIREIVALVEPEMPAAQAALEEKLRQRLLDALGDASRVDDDRIRQEIVLYATKVDVAEELSRLRTHADEVDRILKTGGASGKRLDFLMQELNREANTLGSKAATPVVTSTSMELKLLIEQIREQVQNLE